MTSPVHTLQTRKRMKRTHMDSRIGLLVLTLSCCLCGNCLPVPVPAGLHTTGVAPQDEGLQHYGHKRHTSEAVQTESTEEFNMVLHEGDIILPDTATLDAISRQSSGESKRAVTTFSQLRWENATVPYKFDMNFPTAARKKVLRAISHWHKKTCIRFVPRSDEEEYIKFKLGSVCASSVGRLPSQYIPNYDGQSVILTETCVEKRGNIIHELGHAIGFWHEHTRSDRDDYIEILWDNIASRHTDDFKKRPDSEIDSLGVPYDLNSIMQYSVLTFSRNEQPTIRVRDTSFTGVVGQREGLSDYDIIQTNLFYSCGTDTVTSNEGVETEGLNVIRTGQEIALKAVIESEDMRGHFWINCTEHDCRLDGCPGNRFKPEKQNSCIDHIYSLHKLDGSNGKQAMVGDEVVLRTHSANLQKTVYCGISGNCAPSTACEVDGQFDRQACPDQVLIIKVPSKENGAFLLHKDELVLEYAEDRRDDNQPGSWIGCDLETCQRRKCAAVPNQSYPDGTSHEPTQPTQAACQQDMFTVYKL